MEKKTTTFGQITFRLDIEQHKTLADIAHTLGTDMSGLVKLILADALPTFQARADILKRKQYATAYRVSEEYVPLVHRAIAAGWNASDKGRMKAMREAVLEVRNLDDAALSTVLLSAEREVKKGIIDGFTTLEEFMKGG